MPAGCPRRAPNVLNAFDLLPPNARRLPRDGVDGSSHVSLVAEARIEGHRRKRLVPANHLAPRQAPPGLGPIRRRAQAKDLPESAGYRRNCQTSQMRPVPKPELGIDEQCCGEIVWPVSRLSRQRLHGGEKKVEGLLRVTLGQANRGIGICGPHERRCRRDQGRKRYVQHLRARTIVAVQVSFESAMNYDIPFMGSITPLISRLLVPSGNDQCEITVLMSMPRQHGEGAPELTAKERRAEATHFQRLYDENTI